MNLCRIYDWLFSLMFVTLFVGAIWVSVGCSVPPASEKQEEVAAIDDTTIHVSYSVTANIIYQDNMKYMVARHWDGGVDIRNLTLDSLQVAYYKMMLGY